MRKLEPCRSGVTGVTNHCHWRIVQCHLTSPDSMALAQNRKRQFGQHCKTFAVAMCNNDTLAEWLRRRPAKPMGSPCVGSNPTGVALRKCKNLEAHFPQPWDVNTCGQSAIHFEWVPFFRMHQIVMQGMATARTREQGRAMQAT